MRDRALALILQARGGDRAARILGSLADSRRVRVEEAQARAERDPEGELRQMRGEEVSQLELLGERWLGAAWREINPTVKRYVWRGVLDHVGEDSQR